jgi:hypothetical protein
MQGPRTEPGNTKAKGNAFPIGHLKSQSNALDVTRNTNTFPCGHLTNQSSALDVTRFTQRVSHVALYQRALRWNALVSNVSI